MCQLLCPFVTFSFYELWPDMAFPWLSVKIGISRLDHVSCNRVTAKLDQANAGTKLQNGGAAVVCLAKGP